MNNKAIFWLVGASASLIAAVAFFVWVSNQISQRTPPTTVNNQVTIPRPPAEELYLCSQDSDCIEVLETCCPITMGGRTVSINKQFKDYVEMQRKGKCGEDVPRCKAVLGPYQGTPACVDNRCQFRRDDAQSWKTYRNDQYGFEMKYPPPFMAVVFDSKTNGFQFIEFSESSDPEKPGFAVEIMTTTSTAPTAIEWADEQEWPFPDSWQNHFTKTTIADTTAIQEKTGGVWIKKGNRLYGIGNGIGREDAVLVERTTFDQILSTFKFTSQNDAVVERCRQLVDQAEQYSGAGASYPRQLVLNECTKYLLLYCADGHDCGGFPCVGGGCIVQPCRTDTECPNRMCGLHSTPAPRFCTTIDVQ